MQDLFNKKETIESIVRFSDYLYDLDSSIEYWKTFVDVTNIHYNAIIYIRKILKEYKIGEIYKSYTIICNHIHLINNIFDLYFKHNVDKTYNELVDDYLKHEKSLQRVNPWITESAYEINIHHRTDKYGQTNLSGKGCISDADAKKVKPTNLEMLAFKIKGYIFESYIVSRSFKGN